MHVAIVGQRGNHRAVSLVSELCGRLAAEGVEVIVDEATRAAFDREDVWHGTEEASTTRPESVPVDSIDVADLVVSVGGDGTFLFAARGAGGTPVMGVNLGEVGFLNAVAPADAVEAVLETVAELRDDGLASTRELPRIVAAAPDFALEPALNEVVVQGPQRGHGNGLSVEVRVDGALYTSGHADGVLVATTIGSTAYNLSEGGPLVHPSVKSLVVSEMCGEEAMPSLVLDAGKAVSVRVDDAKRAVVVSDGRLRREVTPPERIVIERASEPVRLAGPPLDFFTALGKLD